MSSIVYFIRAGDNGPIKIGTTTRLKERMKALDCGPYALSLIGHIDGGRTLEKRIHEALVPHRLRLEWFRPTPEVITFVGSALREPENIPALISSAVESNNRRHDKLVSDAHCASRSAVWSIDRICRRVGVQKVAAVADVTDDQISKYRHGKCQMSAVTFLRLQRQWPDDFALFELITGLSHLQLEEVRANRGTLENARDAIDLQLAKLQIGAVA